ncbi:hypothetical protein RB195_013762 [Necator americanus]|uniref:Homeobox domain-containing protein n=1 Tax=Necator americanus TaxID=51031 RepID=A0ABR1DX30_NECAM
METSSCSYPVTGIFDEIPWMSMPPPYYAYPISATGQPGYSVPMTMPHSIAYPSMANWRTSWWQVQEKAELIHETTTEYASEKVKIWFQNQRYKRKHREYGTRDAGTTSSSGANTSVSSLSSPSPDELPDAKLPTKEVPAAQQTTNNIPCSEITFEQSNYSQLYWSQQAAYYPPLNFSAQGFNTSPEEKLSLSTCSEDDLDM